LATQKHCYEGIQLNPNLIRIKQEDKPPEMATGEIQHPNSMDNVVDPLQLDGPIRHFARQNWAWKYRILLD